MDDDLTKDELDRLAELMTQILPMEKLTGFTLFVYFRSGKSQSMSTLPTEVLAKVMEEQLIDMQAGNINDLGEFQIGE